MPNTSSELTIVYRAIADLSAYSANARQHSKRQLRLIAKSIEEFGFTNPVLVDGNHRIIAGHGRIEAARQLGHTNVPTIRLDDLTQDQLRAYVIADNRLAELAGWDKSILAIELQHLVTHVDNLDVTVTGFEVAEIDLIINEANRKQDPDDVIDVSDTQQTITKAGDTWTLGKHRILCGNSLDESSYKLLMGRRRAQVAVTDPPYNVVIHGHASGNGSIRHREFAMASGEMNQAEFVAFLVTVLTLLARYSTAESIHYIFMDWRHAAELLNAGNQTYEALLNICVWVKNNGGMGSFYRSRHELVFVFKNGKGRHRNNVQLGQYGRYRTNVWEYPGATTFSKQGDEGNLLALHPTVKPVALVADALLDCSARGDLVLDPFLGSGTTLMAAERVGRTCLGIEIDPLYVDVAIRRWQRYTGERAVHESSGKCFDDLAVTPEVSDVER